ncbi:MAG TPA: histidinol dehydrogenase [Candidatus Manganitrophaceae bacterium]|nr:histidinol dehydrogenase [Candidatus Manganitrophaceae bacterium]
MKVVQENDRKFKSVYEKITRRLDLGKGPVEKTARKILDDVRKGGDRAVLRYTEKFDRLKLAPSQMRVDPDQIKRAHEKADPEVVESLKFAAERIAAFHEKQKKEGWSIQEKGIYLAQRVHPIERVGLYVPGGKAAYPSSVLMNAIPARVAGVPRMVICSPSPDGIINPYLLIAADLAGVDEIYRIGGVQAVGALAYGTKTVPKVDKIVGPGNQYVAAAKRLVYGLVDIDMVAGPSELLIIADDGADPTYVASDLLSQAEHDEEAVVIFIAASGALVEKVEKEMKIQLARLPRKKIAAASLRNHGVVFIVSDVKKAVEMANEIAPEHLSLFVQDPFSYLDEIVHAGSVFLGEETPQALGDYIAGPNHVLPTGGTARFFSPLSVDDFIKKSSVISYTKEALERSGHHLVRIAGVEGLEAHANMVKIRMGRHA